jgi:putative IMPACT (imprinted ancient) family translation regulator
VLTLAAPVSAECVVKHSRFIAHAGPVNDQTATLKFYEAVADLAATHNCWAWKLEHGYRFNDDGEPASTAGRPILAAIEGKNLVRVMVVVTRHFGGVKLGVGGLIRAYSGAAARCLDTGEFIEVHSTSRWRIETGFEWVGEVHAAMEACEAIKEQEEYTATGIRFELEVRDDRLRQLQALLQDGTRGSAKLVCLSI